MRRPLLFLLLLVAAVGCGIDAVATKSFDGPPDPNAEGGPNLPPRGDAGDTDGPLADAPIDAPADAPLVRPDAGVVFEPSHVQPVYSLTAASVTITSTTTVDTKARTIALNGGVATISSDIVFSDGAAVWSVDSLTVTGKLIVVGDRPLVIVAHHDVTISAMISAFGEGSAPGPGGALPFTGAGRGLSGAKTGDDAAGGGGAGGGTAGKPGGDKGGVKAGLGGPIANPTGNVLVGGSGGGNGGGYAAKVCAEHGRGGAGGGAIQISAVGSITVDATGGIDVGGGGGRGGCRDNTTNKYSGGGGGGAGGLVFLESTTGITIGGTLEASGGGGGEGGAGGGLNADGVDGEAGKYPIGTAFGGFGGFGGDGGNGGVGPALAPTAGSGGDSGGGGGGATGLVFLRTRGATLAVSGLVAAVRTDDQTF